MRFTWSGTKRRANLKTHGLDFVDAPGVFEGRTFTFKDDRFDYGEERYVTLGFVRDVPVSIVHTETDELIRVISFRKATEKEYAILLENL